MALQVTLPELGENVEAAVVVAIFVTPGQSVSEDTPLLELETDKATAELPSPAAGTVDEILVKVGDEVLVGQPLLTLKETAAVVEERAPAPPPAPESPDPEPPPPEPPELTPASGVPHDRPESLVPAGPAVRRLARELGLDVAEVPGTGPDGRISIEGVKAHARQMLHGGGSGGSLDRATPPPLGQGVSAPEPLPDLSEFGPIDREPMGGIRRKTARSISRAWSEAPQVTQNDRADVTELERLRKLWGKQAEAGGGKLTVTAILIKVVATALKVFPRFNAAVDMTRLEVVYRRYVNVGVAVDAGHGLLVPVLRNVDSKNILEIAAELTDLSMRARKKKVAIEEMRGGGFTVTNLGGLGTTTFTPIINWPEVAILGVGRAETRAVHEGGDFVPRLILPLSLTYDHRIIDGGDAARFLRWIAEALEHPLKLAMEG